jgi:hypothetical protein
MKSKLITFFAVLVFASVGIVGVAHAQDDETVKATIPFAFHAGKQTMPAGSYSIGINLETKVISFTNESSKHRTFLPGIPADEGDGTSLLVFNHSGNVYALQELKSDGIDLVFHTRMPVPPMESRNELPQVEVALNR